MAQLDPRHVRLYGPAFSLWDVRDVEAHVRTLLDVQLRTWGARLDAAKYDDALAYLVELCWRLSGLQGDGRTPRVEHIVVLVSQEIHLELGPFPNRDRAETAVSDWRASQDVPPATAITFVERRPGGAYDPKQGLAFSTYSRRILSRRVVDWYRHTFGDTRYGGNHKPLSLDQLVDEWENGNDGSGASESYLDHSGPGARLDVVDELNRHAYYDPFEERDTRSITDIGGTDRAAAAG